MQYLSKLAASLSPYVAGEQPKMKNIIKLNTNENPYPPSPAVASAVQQAVADLRLYPDMDCTALCESIADYNGVRAEQLFCGNGSDEVLAFAFAAFFAGEKLVAPSITYSFYPVYARLFQVDYQPIPMSEGLGVDVDGLMQGSAVALANPNAPTGKFLPITEIERLAGHTHDHGKVLLVDEAYVAFAPDCAVRLLQSYDNLLIVRTLSKSHALAGMRVGYALGSPALIAALKRVRDSFNSYPVDCLAQAAAKAAIDDRAYYDQTTAQIIAARDYAYQALTQGGFDVIPSATNFLFVKADKKDATIVQGKLREQGIIVRHFTAPEVAPYLRVTIGTMENMQKTVSALMAVCQRP